MATTSAMQEKIDDLKKRRQKVMLGGGEDKLEKQRQVGKADGARADRCAGRSGAASRRPACLPSTAPIPSAWPARACRRTEW